MSVLRAVLFDLGYTLLDYPLEGTWREYLRARLEELHPIIRDAAGGAALTAQEFAETAGEIIGGEWAREVEHSGRSWHFLSRLSEALRAVGMRCDHRRMEELAERLLGSVRYGVAPYVDTHETLLRVTAEGLRVAVVSNSPWDTPGRLGRADMQRCGIADFFDAMIFSGDVPWRKPNPEFMWAAARELGVSPEECLVVGDSLRADIQGANEARMRSVWINREGKSAMPGGPQPDWTITTLADVVKIALGEAL